jgi:energy-coupling factor transporter ATP-binding protein EcfA2
MIEYGNQQIPINFQQPLQQFYNNTFNTYADYQIERNMRHTIEQDFLQEYDFIIREAHLLLNEISKNPDNSLTKDSNNLYLTYYADPISNTIDNCNEIEAELFNVLSKEVKIVKDTNTLVSRRREQPQRIYLPLFLIKSKIEPSLVFDIYDSIKDNTFSFNLFTYTDYLSQRISDNENISSLELKDLYKFTFDQVLLFEKDYCIELTQKYFIKLFLNILTINNNSEYIEEWLTYFFKTLRRIKQSLVLIGNRDISEEIFYNGIIKQIFGYDYCLTITDEILEKQSIDMILQNKLFIHITNIPEDEKLQKKLKGLLETIIVYDKTTGYQETPFLCQIIFTLDQPHQFLNDFLSSSKVFFIDSMENINLKLNQPDRISLFNNITKNLTDFSKQLSALDISKIKSYSNKYKYMNLTPQEILNQRTIHHSNKLCLNDTVIFKEKDYKTDNEHFKNWLKNPELMKLALFYDKEYPILDPFNDNFEKILPIENRYKHTYITGKTGSGKSELLKTLIMRDIIRNDSSVILLDIHGDLAQDITRLIKDKERLVLIDPILEKDMTPTINLFDTNDKSEENVEQVSQMITSILNDINVGDSSSGSMIDILENCIPLLVRSKNKDFYDLKRLMKDIPKVTGAKDKKELIQKQRDKIEAEINKFHKNRFEEEYFEDEFMSVNNSTRQAIRRRLNKMLKDSKFSNLTNGKSTIDLAKEMNTKGKVIIFNIPKSKMLNTYNHYIKFIIGLIQIIALKRADLKEKNRPYTHLYIDEFHNFITPTIEEILTESRKYKLFLTFAHQSVSQIKDTNLRDIILDNTNVKIIGKNSNKTLDIMNKTLNTKLEDVAKLTAGEFNLQSGNNDVIKIYNTDKLLDGKESISDEEWEKYKQYQLEHYYRNTTINKVIISITSKDYLDTKIDEFIKEIKSIEKIQAGDVSYFDKIKDVDINKYNILIHNFNDDVGYISRQELSFYFNIIYDKQHYKDNDNFLEDLKNKDTFFKINIDKNRTHKGQKRYKLG